MNLQKRLGVQHSKYTQTIIMKSKRTSPSLELFRAYIVRSPTGEIDATGLFSRSCYLAWLRAKAADESQDEAKRFLRALTNHVSATDGRSSFEEDEEIAVLLILRSKKPWPCFPPDLAHFGQRYRAMGFHEKLRATTNNEYNINHLQHLLSAEDATFMHGFCESVVANYFGAVASSKEEVYDLLRFTILGRTGRCCTDVPPLCVAQELCNRHAQQPGVSVMVFDMMAKSYADHVLAQSNLCMTCDMVYGWATDTDVVCALVAICGAYFRPGIEFPIARQQLGAQFFDLVYFVDVDTCLLVMKARILDK